MLSKIILSSFLEEANMATYALMAWVPLTNLYFSSSYKETLITEPSERNGRRESPATVGRYHLVVRLQINLKGI